SALRTPLMNALWNAHKDRLSIVNGIMMLPKNVGHGENSAYLWGGAERGGGPIYPPAIGKRMGGAPLDAVILRDFLQIFPQPSNLAGSAELASREVVALSQTLGGGPTIDEASPRWQHIVARADMNGAGDGQFAAGSRNLAQALRRAKATGDAFIN